MLERSPARSRAGTALMLVVNMSPLGVERYPAAVISARFVSTRARWRL